MFKSEHCRFCEVPVDKANPKLNNLTAQLIQYHYIDEFYFYFAKPINEILAETRSPEYAAFREMQVQVVRPKLSFAFYNQKDCTEVIRRKSIHRQKLLVPLLSDQRMMEKLLKDSSKKQKLHLVGSPDEDERIRYQRRKQQLPLRDGLVLNDEREGFVNLDSFETKLFDIYNPEYSSILDIKEPPMKSILIERLKKGAYPSTAPQNDQRNSLKPSQKIQIPLLCLKKPHSKLFTQNSHLSEALPKAKQQASQDPTKSKGFMGSDNQSTQFSMTCIFNKNTRRKQVLEDIKRSSSRQRSNNKIPPKHFASSPKISKKKKAVRDDSLKQGRRLRKSKDIEGSKNPVPTTGSLFNSRSWKLLKSWDQLMGGRFRDGSMGDQTLSRTDLRPLKKEIVDKKEKKSQILFNDNLKSHKAVVPIKAGGNVSCRKLALSPRGITERPLTQREETYKSFKEKCNFKNAKQRGYKKPLWIGVPDHPDKKSIRELLLKPDGIVGFRTQGSLNFKKAEFEKKITRLETVGSEMAKTSGRIHREWGDFSGLQKPQPKHTVKDRTKSEDAAEQGSQEKGQSKVSLSGASRQLTKKKKGLSIKDWKKVAGEAAAKEDLTSSNHFLTSRSCTRRQKDSAQIASERHGDKEPKCRTKRAQITKSHPKPAHHGPC